MKSNLESISTLERKLNIVVPAQEVQAAFERAFKGIQKHATVKGFRKGKAPLTTIKQLFGDRVKNDVVQDLVNQHYSSAVTEHKVEPVSFPAIEFDDLEEQKDFEFTAEFEVRPEVKVTQFEKLPLKKEKFEMKDELVQETLDQIRTSRAELVPVLEDRPAQNGDTAVIDFRGELLTGPLENGSGENHPLELGTNSFIPGFEEGVVGMKVGQTKAVQISFPEGYHAAELSGKPVTFHVTLKELKKKQMPEITDEFVAELGGKFKTVDELKAGIREDFEKRESARIEEETRNRIMKALVERNPVDVPKALLTEQKKALVEDTKKRMAQQGMRDDQFGDYESKWDADFTKSATFMIQASFLIDVIARDNNLYATPEDVEAKLKQYAEQTGIEIDRVREFYNDKDRKGRMAYQITEEKVADFLISKADVKTATREEIESEERKDA